MLLEGLEGKMNDVNIGDIIRISNPKKNMEASGYVVKLTKTLVDLSHENPFAQVSWCPNRIGFTRGDRGYMLGRFTAYEILKKYRT